MKTKLSTAISFALLTSATFSSLTFAAPVIEPELQSRLVSNLLAQDVIISFHQQNQVTSVMQELGVKYIGFKSLPMASAWLTTNQINTLSQRSEVKSVYLNKPLSYNNFTSGEITQGHYVQDNYGVTGSGVTVAVLDSGVDGTHPDLTMGEKTIENVKIVGDLDFAGGLHLFLEGFPNSDTSSGHGTHVAGTVAGTGAASAADERRANYHDGIAPNANIVGLGAGEGISILYALLGFEYAIANRERYSIDIITNSWGGGDGEGFDPYDPINQASFTAYEKGMVVTFAASNSGPAENTINKYALAPWVVNVAAGTPQKGLADFSSRGVAGDEWKHPDITAPGAGITSTRAVNTAIGATGPVNDPDHPDYYLRYHTLSGTSMATPFIAGVSALLLEANPHLSPDQIEEILMTSAETMPGYQFHEVGAGYVDVKAAVDMAKITQGERLSFVAGDTDWASNGNWLQVDDQDSLIDYLGRWRPLNDSTSYEGSYNVSKRGAAGFKTNFRGERIKLAYNMNNKGGLAEVLIDGQSYGTISFYSQDPQAGVKPINGLSDGDHALEVRALYGAINLDSLAIDGVLIDNSLTYEEQTLNYNGTMGPSAENLSVHEIEFVVDDTVMTIDASLSWAGVSDLDFYLVDPEGNEVASSASLSNPESIAYWVEQPGTYKFRVTGYISLLTDYAIENTLTRAIPSE